MHEICLYFLDIKLVIIDCCSFVIDIPLRKNTNNEYKTHLIYRQLTPVFSCSNFARFISTI